MMSRDRFPSSWMLGNNTRPIDQDQAMEESGDQNLAQRSTTTGFFRVPGLFVRLSSKGLMDPDLVWSPTSPLDFKNLLSNIGSTNLRSPRSPGVEADRKPRASPPRVGLGLVDALTADESSQFGRKNSVLESIRPFLELGLPKISDMECDGIGPVNGSFMQMGVLLSEVAQSEEYTCIIERGPNPRTTHILGDETLEIRLSGPSTGENGSGRSSFIIESLEEPVPVPSTPVGVAGFCCYCSKRLQEGRDIYMYLGEKAFCSNECRKSYIEEEIEEMEFMMVDSAGSSALFVGEDCLLG